MNSALRRDRKEHKNDATDHFIKKITIICFCDALKRRKEVAKCDATADD